MQTDHLLNILLSFKNLQGQNDDFFLYQLYLKGTGFEKKIFMFDH